MAYFSHGDTRQKLMLLFYLHRIDTEITRNQLFRIFAEQDWMDYFDFQSRLNELEEDALVAAIPCAFGQGYRVTPQGEQTLSMFLEELPFSLREKLAASASANREFVRSEAQFHARRTPMPDGGSLAVLRLLDKTSHILDISLRFPNAELAQAACDAWPQAAEEIYVSLLRALLPDDPGQS